MSLLLLFRPFGAEGPQPPPVVVEPPGGGDSTRLRRRRRRAKLRYWWEKDEPDEVITVLPPAQALLEPVVVEALWEERAHLNDYIIELSATSASKRVLAKLAEVDKFLKKRIEDAEEEETRKRRRKKAVWLLLH
jgi:hypothetical protein